jgi:ABC-type multidrug transport system ATPase subunit
MNIELQNIGKRYKKNWIFKGLSTLLEQGKSYALVGSNGAGKSTLLKVIAGFENHHVGTIQYSIGSKTIHKQDLAPYFSFCAPYQELIREMKLVEFLSFHQSMTHPMDTQKMLAELGLEGNEDKLLDEFSSGMLQRLKLGITFYSARPVLFFDEPCTNLDAQGKKIFSVLFDRFKDSKLILIASNEPEEIALCSQKIAIENYKTLY